MPWQSLIGSHTGPRVPPVLRVLLGVQLLYRQLLVVPRHLVEVRLLQLAVEPLDLRVQLRDPLVVVRPLQPEDDGGVSGVEPTQGSVLEVLPDASQDPGSDAVALQLALGQVVEDAVGRAPQQREGVQVRELVLLHVLVEVPQFQPVRLDFLAPLGTEALGDLQPAQLLIQLGQALAVRSFRCPRQERGDPLGAGFLSGEETLLLVLVAQVRGDVAEAQFVELLPNVVDSGVGLRDDPDRPALHHDVGEHVQDRLGLAGTGRPLDDRDAVREGVLDRLALTEVAPERKDRSRSQVPRRDRCAGQVRAQRTPGVALQLLVHPCERVLAGELGHDGVPVAVHVSGHAGGQRVIEYADLRSGLGAVGFPVTLPVEDARPRPFGRPERDDFEGARPHGVPHRDLGVLSRGEPFRIAENLHAVLAVRVLLTIAETDADPPVLVELVPGDVPRPVLELPGLPVADQNCFTARIDHHGPLCAQDERRREAVRTAHPRCGDAAELPESRAEGGSKINDVRAAFIRPHQPDDPCPVRALPTRVDALSRSGADSGHDDLAEAVAGFCDRWQAGVQDVAKDAQEVAGRLSRSAEEYSSPATALAGLGKS